MTFTSSSLCPPDAPPPDIYTLSLHDALPICHFCPKKARLRAGAAWHRVLHKARQRYQRALPPSAGRKSSLISRSEEHTSELQSRGHLVCRLLLEKKKTSTRPRGRRPAWREEM